MSNGLVKSGAIMMVLAVVIPLVLFAAMVGMGDSWEAFIGAAIVLVVVVPLAATIGFVGLILLIVGLASGGSQQQQQQVVVYSDGGTGTVCPRCQAVVEEGIRFCTTCGGALRG